MKTKKIKHLIVVAALIGTFLMFGATAKNAHADTYIDYCGLSVTYSMLYQGYGQGYAGSALYYGDVSAMYYAYLYWNAAAENALDASDYAAYSSEYYAYEAYYYAGLAYDSLYDATVYAYYAYVYDDVSYTHLALLFGGQGAQLLAIANYYSAVLY